MPPKKQIPAPIDRPLSRAYLREFTGWSTAYPPGISDPTSLRIMENVMVNRDGSARIRPGLRYLSYDTVGSDLVPAQKPLVGSHEPFFLNDGSKAYLFAVREDDGTVGFRVLASDIFGMTVHALDEAGVDFVVPQGIAALAFTSATTYVKYLQIDNKIFALSNAGETMRLFTVGEIKTAKTLSSVERPEFTVADKLTVVEPDKSWIDGVTPTSVRRNRSTNPSMQNVADWEPVGLTKAVRSTAFSRDGLYSLAISSLPERVNYMVRPLHNVSGLGFTGWSAANDNTVLSAVTGFGIDGMKINNPSSSEGHTSSAWGPSCPVNEGEELKITLDLEDQGGALNSLLVRWNFYNTSGAIIGSFTDTPVSLSTLIGDRRSAIGTVVVPNNAVTAKHRLIFEKATNATAYVVVSNVLLAPASQVTTMLSGSSGANFFWEGPTNNSMSVFHPPQDVEVRIPVDPVTVANWNSSAYFRAGTVVRNVTALIRWRGGTGGTTSLAVDSGSATADTTGGWTRVTVAHAAAAGTTNALARFIIAAVPHGETHYMDSHLFESGLVVGVFFDGSGTNTGTVKYEWLGDAHHSQSTESTYPAAGSIPPAEARTADTLISSTSADNDFNFGFFYTFNNEIGESAPSMVTTVRAQRSWQAWRWEIPNAAGEPSGTDTPDPTACADQLVASMPQSVFEAAIDQGAIAWNLYMVTWSDQDPVPVTAVRIGQRVLTPGLSHAANGWLRMTPQMADAGDESASLPSVTNRFNFSNPSRGGQGVVASDRMVLVNDPTSQAVIRWTSNQQGHYTDFSAARGGGFKTLTSGNLFVPACVKLWQNPQSVDTLTILCMGVDGMSTGYYMAPVQVAQQSEATNIMGFEETTATPGTTSPYGVEVLNNALYHPLDEMLMKSTANNYNINHKSITDQIFDVWRSLTAKRHIVSAQHDNRIYYLVNNPQGALLEAGCWGNEVWVFDAQAEAGTWARWLVQGQSLRKIDNDGRVAMSLVRPDGIYYFDDLYGSDDYVTTVDDDPVIAQRAIPWKLETNSQGANRAHDAWANLQQCNVTLGFFTGTMRYGVRAWDVNGKAVDISTVVHDDNDPSVLAFDLDSFLLIRKVLREWFFYAESVVEDDIVQASYGQIDLVQYRYTPSSVNTGYEYGSVETFEYQRGGNPIDSRTTDNGVPIPMTDTRRP